MSITDSLMTKYPALTLTLFVLLSMGIGVGVHYFLVKMFVQ